MPPPPPDPELAPPELARAPPEPAVDPPEPALEPPALEPPELELVPLELPLTPPELAVVLPALELVPPVPTPLDPAAALPVPPPELAFVAPFGLDPPEQPPTAATAMIVAVVRSAGRVPWTTEREVRMPDFADFMRGIYYVHARGHASTDAGGSLADGHDRPEDVTVTTLHENS
jgi:hypothetical protein